MLYKTKGIVLHQGNYSESSIIVKVFTEVFGLQSYIINGVRSRKSKVKANLFQPLSLLEMVVYHKENRGLQRISEVKTGPVLQNIPNDILKSTVVLFLDEILYKSLKEEGANLQMFSFLWSSIQILDLKKENYSSFHIYFMIQLTKYLGFYPGGSYNESGCFNLREGLFQAHLPAHQHYISGAECSFLNRMLQISFDRFDECHVPASSRKELLEKMILYYRLHIENFPEIKSHKILEEILH